jgi:DNA-binding NarL/FixJ family response regulator
MASGTHPTPSVVDAFVGGLRAGEPRAVQAAERLLGTMSRTHHHPLELSARQVEVLGRVAHGLTDGEIGLELGISALTVREHVRRSKHVLGARNRVHLIVLWVAQEATQSRSDAAHTPPALPGSHDGADTA